MLGMLIDLPSFSFFQRRYPKSGSPRRRRRIETFVAPSWTGFMTSCSLVTMCFAVLAILEIAFVSFSPVPVMTQTIRLSFGRSSSSPIFLIAAMTDAAAGSAKMPSVLASSPVEPIASFAETFTPKPRESLIARAAAFRKTGSDSSSSVSAPAPLDLRAVGDYLIGLVQVRIEVNTDLRSYPLLRRVGCQRRTQVPRGAAHGPSYPAPLSHQPEDSGPPIYVLASGVPLFIIDKATT